MSEQKQHFERRQWTVFKNNSMMTLELMPGRWDANRNKQTKPGLLVSMAPSIGKMKYDWEQREVFALNLTEIGDLLAYIRGRIKKDRLSFIHKPNGDFKSKNGKIFALSPAGSGNNIFWVNLSVNEGNKNVKLDSSLTAGEVQIFSALLQQATVEMCNWKI